MTARTCPACARRFAGLVDADCVVCGGHGTVELGAAALHKNDPAVVARAIEGYLEATLAMASRTGLDEKATTRALAASVHELKHAGLVRDLKSQPQS